MTPKFESTKNHNLRSLNLGSTLANASFAHVTMSGGKYFLVYSREYSTRKRYAEQMHFLNV